MILAEKMVMYGGAGIFVMHVLRNKMKITKRTPILVVVPYLLQIVTKMIGTKWIDFSM